MRHITLTGSHWEAGYQQGSALGAGGERLLDRAPFPVTETRIQFARACLPVCKRWFPAVLEEIQGLAEGRDCPFAQLAGILLPMYCLIPQAHCSTFALRRNGRVILGRNSDFLTCVEDQNANCLYRFTDGGYAFLGNTTAFVEMEDGVNERGLAAGLTSVFPGPPEAGLNAGMLLRLVLERCAGVEEDNWRADGGFYASMTGRQGRTPSGRRYDLTAGRMYRAEGNPGRTPFHEDTRLTISG